ncbi:reverse transcriptase domain-containing protein [Tanacetum coccineum]
MDQEITTFTCPFGTYAYRRMPFGLCNAPTTFQRCMLAIFHDMIKESVEVFMDDFSIFGNSCDNCLNNLDKMLQHCKDAHLVLKWEKCHFMVKERIVLGHKVFKAGLEVDKAKIDVISKLPHPTNIKDTPFEFNDECHTAFNLLKEKLMCAPVIVIPNWNLSFKLMCDASDFAVGAVLVIAFDKIQSYLVLSKTIVHTDHSALRHIFKKQDAKPRLIRWILLLQEFDIEIKDKKGTKNVIVDHLSRIENDETSDDGEVDDNFPGETLMKINTRDEPWFTDFANYLGTTVRVEFGDATAAADPAGANAIARSFPHTYGQPLAHFFREKSKTANAQTINEHPKSTLLRFLGGSEGLFAQKTLDIADDVLATYKNKGGYDLLGRTKDQIRTTKQVNSAMAACKALNMDGLNIVGGVTFNTNTAQLAETFAEAKCATKVVGVPVTLNGDLKHSFCVLIFTCLFSFFLVNSQLISNVCTDALSAEKYYYFIRIMGRKASHVALECTLQSHPNMLPIPTHPALLPDLIVGLDRCLQYYTSKAKSGCGSRNTFIPAMLALTRCAAETKFHGVLGKKRNLPIYKEEILSHSLWDGLYVGELSSSAIEPFLQDLEQNLMVIAYTMNERVRTRLVAEIMKASLKGFCWFCLRVARLVLLLFNILDKLKMTSSLSEIYYGLTVTGLPMDVINKFSATTRDVIPLFRTETETVIERFRRVTLETYGSSTKSRLPLPATIGQWSPSDPNTLLRNGQALSTRPYILPSVYRTELAKLQDQIPLFSTKVAICSIETQLGAPISQLFADISPEPMAAASLVQVYTAHLHTRELVVVKVQRPGMSLSLTLDAMLFNMIGGQLKRFANARKDIIVAVNETVSFIFENNGNETLPLYKSITSLRDRIVSDLLLCMVSVTDTSEVLQAYTYVWGNSTDTDLYVDWDFEIDAFEQEYGVIKMVGLMIVSDAYHGCFHVFVTMMPYMDAGLNMSLRVVEDGHSNAINIAERLGLPNVVVGNARELDGTASAEINEHMSNRPPCGESYLLLHLAEVVDVIEDMEKLKQKLHEHIHEARHHLKLARELHRNLVVSERRIREHATSQRYIKIQEISEGGGVARSLLHKKVRQRRASPVLVSKADDSPLQPKMASFSSQSTPKESDAALVSESNVKNQELGDLVHVSKFNKNAVGLKVDPSKEEILVQLGNMKLKLTLLDVAMKARMGDLAQSLGMPPGNPEIIFKTHPNINKDLFSNENILGSKYPNRPFPASQLRMQSKDASAVPLTSKFLYVSVSMLDDGLILIEVASIVPLKGGPHPKYS